MAITTPLIIIFGLLTFSLFSDWYFVAATLVLVYIAAVSLIYFGYGSINGPIRRQRSGLDIRRGRLRSRLLIGPRSGTRKRT